MCEGCDHWESLAGAAFLPRYLLKVLGLLSTLTRLPEVLGALPPAPPPAPGPVVLIPLGLGFRRVMEGVGWC